MVLVLVVVLVVVAVMVVVVFARMVGRLRRCTVGVGSRYGIAMVAKATLGSPLQLGSWQMGRHKREVPKLSDCSLMLVVNNTVGTVWEAETRCLLLVSAYPNVPP